MNANKQDAGGLLPCPFCGGRAEAGPCDDRFTRWFLACQSCGASTDTCKASDRFEAVRNLASSWNRRDGEQCRAASEEDVEALCESLEYMAKHSDSVGFNSDAECLRTAAGLLRALSRGVPEGMVLVPVEPTPEMETAHRMYGDTSDWWQSVISAAIAAQRKEG